MPRKTRQPKWLPKVEEHDFAAAASYLGLIHPQAQCKTLVAALRATGLTQFKAKDIFRASGLSLLGISNSHVEKDRPWYKDKVTPTFTDMLGALRLQMWEHRISEESGEEAPSPECIRRLLHTLSAVA